jgi:pilus assembly protein CpaB
MAQRKYSAILYFAILVAIAATYGVYRVVDQARRGSAIAMKRVVVAKDDIPLGSAIEEWMITVKEWPAPVVPEGTFVSEDSVIGRVVRVDVFPGDAIVPGRLAPLGTAPGLEAKITPGKRAMSVRIDDVSGLSGMVQPNSRVDVLLTLDGRSSKLFMPNMRILAMGSEVERDEDGDPINTTVATLEVTTAEGERLAVATAQGKIQLMLRGYQDPEIVATKGATSSEVLASLREAPTPPRVSRPAPQQKAEPAPPVQQPVESPKPAAAPPRSDSLTIPVFRGAKKSEEKFKKDSVRRDTIRP